MNTSTETFRMKSGRNYIIKFNSYITDAGYDGDKVSSHTPPEINYFVAGSGKYKIDNMVYEFKAGDIFFIPPGLTHRIIERYETSNHVNIWFVPDSLKLDLGKTDMVFNDLLIKIKADEKIRIDSSRDCYNTLKRIVSELCNEIKSKRPGYTQMVEILLAELTMQIVREFNCLDGGATVSGNSRVQAIDDTLDYIQASIKKNFTLDELAKVANMSPKHYGAVFKEINGITPWEYITSKKMELAKNLLADKSKSIMEVAYECGYANIANFNRAFKKCTQQTPSEYRKKL